MLDGKKKWKNWRGKTRKKWEKTIERKINNLDVSCAYCWKSLDPVICCNLTVTIYCVTIILLVGQNFWNREHMVHRLQSKKTAALTNKIFEYN